MFTYFARKKSFTLSETCDYLLTCRPMNQPNVINSKNIANSSDLNLSQKQYIKNFKKLTTTTFFRTHEKKKQDYFTAP